jgi:hypothetical protein
MLGVMLDHQHLCRHSVSLAFTKITTDSSCLHYINRIFMPSLIQQEERLPGPLAA